LARSNQTCYEKIETIKTTCRYNGEVVCAGGGVSDCNSCYQADIEHLQRQVNLLTVDIASFGYCQDLQTQTIAAANQVESDMDALIVALQTEDTAKWQAVWDDYNTGCGYMPNQYCGLIETSSGSATPACQLVNNACVAV